ncbi:hypothetical protein GCM10020256_37510 [Streptomyces thermocoprophilus]
MCGGLRGHGADRRGAAGRWPASKAVRARGAGVEGGTGAGREGVGGCAGGGADRGGRGGGARVVLLPRPLGAFGAVPRRQGTDLVEDLDDLVVRSRFRQEFHRRGEGLARPCRRAETVLRVGLEEGRHDLPQRLGDALGGRPVCRAP